MNAKLKLKPWMIALTIPFLLFLGCELNHVYNDAFIAAHNAEGMGRIKKINDALDLYLADNNETFPHASTMATFESQVRHYGENLVFEEEFHYSPVQFNFNLAAVRKSDIYNHSDTDCNGDHLIVLYALSKGKEAYSLACKLEGSIRPTEPENIIESFKCQYPRSVNALASADYRANQDPHR